MATGDPRPLATLTAAAMTGLTAAFAFVILLDVQLYGHIPDAALIPIQLLLLMTAVVCWTRWRWAPAVGAAVAVAVGIGNAVQPITMVRLSNPESTLLQWGTLLTLALSAAAAVTGTAATISQVKQRRRVATSPRRGTEGPAT